MKRWYRTYNHAEAVKLADLPQFDYAGFHADILHALGSGAYRCATYFGVPGEGGIRMFCLLANDTTSEVLVATTFYDTERQDILPSLTAHFPEMHPFERELAENYGIPFGDNPWNKPLRFAHDRADRSRTMNNYPFYGIAGESLHEVNVGPVHAGIIEPGVFRFICNGEEVIHLEIVLGYQHRGIERLIRSTPNRLRQMTLAESIAGDSIVAHGSAFATMIEKLSPDPDNSPAAGENGRLLDMERAIALELERIAVHLGDTAALCMDVGYQLGQVACEALRTIIVNTRLLWCGNRFGKGLIRPGGTHYPMTVDLRRVILKNLGEVERRYRDIARNLTAVPSVSARFEDCGTVTRRQALRIGAVGPAARASGLSRDARATHPWGSYRHAPFRPVVKTAGDVMARLQIRLEEVLGSITLIREFLDIFPDQIYDRTKPLYHAPLQVGSFAFSLIEGWRGEVCHAAVTDGAGNLEHYKITDPSLHNWMALALAVRGAGISDFPVCNKSFNLSYCGHDL